MEEKKSFFSFFRGIRSSYDDSVAEETKQREYALSKVKEENIKPAIPKEKPVEKIQDDEPQEPSQITREMEELSIKKLEEFLSLAGFMCEIKVIMKPGTRLYLEILGEKEDIGLIIGREGQTLSSLQIILNSILFKQFNTSIKVILDAGGYRRKRIDTIKSKALKAAKSVIQFKKKIDLEPMNAAERRAIHIMFKQDSKINCYSEGEGHDRHIVLEPMKKENGFKK